MSNRSNSCFLLLLLSIACNGEKRQDTPQFQSLPVPRIVGVQRPAADSMHKPTTRAALVWRIGGLFDDTLLVQPERALITSTDILVTDHATARVLAFKLSDGTVRWISQWLAKKATSLIFIGSNAGQHFLLERSARKLVTLGDRGNVLAEETLPGRYVPANACVHKQGIYFAIPGRPYRLGEYRNVVSQLTEAESRDSPLGYTDTKSPRSSQFEVSYSSSHCVFFGPQSSKVVVTTTEDHRKLSSGTENGDDSQIIELFLPHQNAQSLTGQPNAFPTSAAVAGDKLLLLYGGIPNFEQRRVDVYSMTTGEYCCAFSVGQRPRVIAGRGSFVAVIGEAENGSFDLSLYELKKDR